MQKNADGYYVPESSYWPIFGAVSLITIVIGAARILHEQPLGWPLLGVGLTLLSFTLFRWFKDVIDESMAGKCSQQMDRSYRMGMAWFIFSEVMFFLAFFGALFYVTAFSVPWLGGLGAKGISGELLWPSFIAEWPLLVNPSSEIPGPHAVIPAWGLPAINTLILLLSGVTITWAHWSLKFNLRRQLIAGLAMTIILGIVFLALQAVEYIEAYSHMGLRLDSGIYGSTFYMLTGFHGLHVTIGTVMLLVILARCCRGHFTPDNHFGFEGVAWYWHFVDYVWLALFIIVYWRPDAVF